MNAAAIALNRFGLGAIADQPALADPPRWLVSQFDRYEPLPTPWQPAPRTPALLDAWLAQQRAARQAPDGEKAGIRETYLRQAREAYVAAVGARVGSALQTPAPFVERLVHFWSNHFAVSVDKLAVVGLAGGFEADAIRPHVLGRFTDLLLAAEGHPAMLFYLDQTVSMGANSTAGINRTRGLNENLAREILVKAAAAVEAGSRIRAHRNRLVEIEQHRRMALGRQQQVGEATEHVRADSLALVSAGHAADLVGRDAKMIGPEPDQPLGKSDFSGERRRGPNPHLFEIDRPPRIGHGLGGHLRRHLARI